VSTAIEAQQPPGPLADGLRLSPVVLFGHGAPQTGLTLSVDDRGIVVSGGTGGERALPWHRVTGWQVDPWAPQPGAPGAVVTYRTLRAVYRFGVPGVDAAALGRRVDQLARGYVAPQAAVPTTEGVAEPPPSVLEERVRRLRPVLVVVLIVVLAVMVALVLLQSAGVIDLPWLGGNGSTGPGALARHAARASA
jgi:hypothetical protein